MANFKYEKVFKGMSVSELNEMKAEISTYIKTAGEQEAIDKWLPQVRIGQAVSYEGKGGKKKKGTVVGIFGERVSVEGSGVNEKGKKPVAFVRYPAFISID